MPANTANNGTTSGKKPTYYIELDGISLDSDIKDGDGVKINK